MRRTLKNDSLEQEFQQNGYVIVPFLNDSEVETLTSLYFDTLEESGGHLGPSDENHDSKYKVTYDFTFIDKNIEYKKKVFKLITDKFANQVAELLDNYKPIIANFIRKKENGGEVPLHQNWAFVDEHKCTSVSIWCPLVDSSRKNGTLEVVPKSHKRFGEVRGPMIRSELLDIENDIKNDFLVPLELKAGQAVILDDSIVHYSSPNNSEGLRLAIQLILIPNEEPSIHFHMDLEKSKTQVNVLEVDHDFYMKFNPWKKPPSEIKKTDSFDFKTFSLSISEFEAMISKHRFDENVPSSWKEKINSFFS